MHWLLWITAFLVAVGICALFVGLIIMAGKADEKFKNFWRQ